MAFVYRSPRHMPFETPTGQNQEQLTTEQKQEQNISENSSIKKKPIKGLAYSKNNNNLQQSQSNQLYITTTPKQIIQIQQKFPIYQQKIIKKIQNNKYTFNQQKQQNNKLSFISQQQLKCKGQKFYQSKNYQPKLFTNQQQSNIDSQVQQKIKTKTKEKVKQLSNVSQISMKLNKTPSQNNSLIEINANLLSSKLALGKVLSIPSIPGKLEKYGYVINQNHISYPKLVTLPKDDTPSPASYSYTLPTKAKSVICFDTKSPTVLKIRDNTEPYPLINDQQALANHNSKIKQWLEQKKKIKSNQHSKKQLYKLTLNSNQFSTTSDQSSQQTIYQDNTTPGPGYYYYQHNYKKNFRSKNKEIRQIFYSKSNRFTIQKQKKYHLSNLHDNNNDNISQQKKNKNKFFISKLKRQIKFQNHSTTPPPGYYNIRASMQNDVIQNILKTSPNLFNNKLPRLINLTSSTTPGPGTYSINISHLKTPNLSPTYHQKQISKKCDHLPPPHFNKQSEIYIDPIKQVKAKRIHQQQYLPHKQQHNTTTFISKSSKGLPYSQSPNSKAYQHKKKPKQPIKQNVHPFNSSSKKNQQTSPHYLAQIGLYQLCQQNSLQKKSYNILFN